MAEGAGGGVCDKAQTKKGGKSTAQVPEVRLNFWLFVAKNTVPGTQNPFVFLFPSELLVNCWAQLIVNYTQQAPTITSIEENVHHMPDHKCLFPTGVTSFLSKKLFILFLMMLAPSFFFNKALFEAENVESYCCSLGKT